MSKMSKSDETGLARTSSGQDDAYGFMDRDEMEMLGQMDLL